MSDPMQIIGDFVRCAVRSVSTEYVPMADEKTLRIQFKSRAEVMLFSAAWGELIVSRKAILHAVKASDTDWD